MAGKAGKMIFALVNPNMKAISQNSKEQIFLKFSILSPRLKGGLMKIVT